jgi:WD repeat and FYVE domain-containing protein 3
VSKNLHKWVDLIFGYKQRGPEAVKALNTFVHVTYEGEVDLDAMTDPIQRASTIAQIQNFGQTPSRLERKPFPPKNVASLVKQSAIDFGSLAALTPLTPPFCIVGAPHRVGVRSVQTDICRLGLFGQADNSVGDLCLVKGQIVGVGRLCTLVIAPKHYIRFGGVNNGFSIHTAAVTTRYRESNKLISMHDALHRAPISAAKTSFSGDWVVTGCVDSTVRIWKYDEQLQLQLKATLCGHDGAQIKCIDLSTEFGLIVTGCSRGRILFWDLRTFTFVRKVHDDEGQNSTLSISINHKNGYVLTLVGAALNLYDINGNLMARSLLDDSDAPTCAVATDCSEWMEDGIVAVTGHLSGEIRFWSTTYDDRSFVLRHVLQDNPHTDAITALRVTGNERLDTLLVGDLSGKMSVCKTHQLESFSTEELSVIVEELQGTKSELASEPKED